MSDFTSLLVGGIPLMIVIFGLIEFSKSLGLSGRILTIVSMALGILFGVAYQYRGKRSTQRLCRLVRHGDLWPGIRFGDQWIL